jgi:hypothetical protein
VCVCGVCVCVWATMHQCHDICFYPYMYPWLRTKMPTWVVSSPWDYTVMGAKRRVPWLVVLPAEKCYALISLL